MKRDDLKTANIAANLKVFAATDSSSHTHTDTHSDDDKQQQPSSSNDTKTSSSTASKFRTSSTTAINIVDTPEISKISSGTSSINKNKTSDARTVLDTRASGSESKSGPKGVPKSGRVWKRVRHTRFSSIKVDKPLRTTWETKQAQKADQKAIKMMDREFKEKRAANAKAQRLSTEQKRKWKTENEKKSEVVQVIKNTAKIKRMKKKQLKNIETR